MKRTLYLTVVVACALLFGSCNKERQAERLREKIQFVSLDDVTPHGLSGVDAVVTVANHTRHNITLEGATLTLNYRDNSVAMLQLRDEVLLPKRFEGQLSISTRMKIYDPLSAVGVWARIRNNNVENMTVSVEAQVKAGPVRKNISIEKMELQKFLSKFALSTEEVERI